MALVTCPECKSQVSDQAPACPRCGLPRGRHAGPTSGISSDVADIVRRHSVAPPEEPHQQTYRPTAAATVHTPSPPYYQTPRRHKSPGLAALLNLVVWGPGQFYNGQLAKGMVFLLLWAVGWFSIVFFHVIAIIVSFVLWMAAMYDAYDSARRINEGGA